MKNSNIILIGFMGVGKDTIGKILAQKLGYKFVSVDSMVEQNAGKSLTEITLSEGEIKIRETEHKILNELLKSKKRVISTGGDIVVFEKNRDLLPGLGLIILLNTSPDEITERMKQTPYKRYQFIDTDDKTLQREITDLMESRQKIYKSIMHAEINTFGKSPMQTVSEIVDVLRTTL